MLVQRLKSIYNISFTKTPVGCDIIIIYERFAECFICGLQINDRLARLTETTSHFADIFFYLILCYANERTGLVVGD